MLFEVMFLIYAGILFIALQSCEIDRAIPNKKTIFA